MTSVTLPSLLAARAFHVSQDIDRIKQFEEEYEAVTSLYNPDFEVLSVDMVHEFRRVMQKPDEFIRKMNFCNDLKAAILKINPTWVFNIVPTGSSVSGLATENSDLDVAIHIPQIVHIIEEMCSGKQVSDEEKMIMRREKQLEILQIVRLILQNDESIKNRLNHEKELEIVQAQIQILKVVTIDGVECDISVVLDLFLSSMHNSFMIKHFAQIDNRFAILCYVVKKWADSTGVKNPKDGGFNSYALVLLVIHFLQCGTSPPVLPNLMKVYADDCFFAQNENDFPQLLDFGAGLPRKLPSALQNETPIAQLFMEFLHYYSEFNFQTNYISIKNASVYDRKANMLPRAALNEQHKQVYIEDPFDSHNPGRTVRTIKSIKKMFKTTLDKFDPRTDPKCSSSTDSKSTFKFPSLDDILNMSTSQEVLEELEEEREKEQKQEEEEEVEEPVNHEDVFLD